MDRQKYKHYNHIEEINGKKLTIKEKKHEVYMYMLKYRKAKIEIQYQELLEIEDDKKRKDKQVQYIDYINEIIDALSEDSKTYIVNEYIKNFNNPSWWKEKYNRSTYFKVRENALNEFLLYVL